MMKRWFAPAFLLLVVLGTLAFVQVQQQAEAEREAVIETLHSIFQAFIDQDAETLRATHAQDWMGFKANGHEIVRGIEGYMKDVSFRYPMLDYRIDDVDVQFFGDLAVVYYVGQYRSDLKEYGEVMTTKIRAVDLFRKQADSWIQVGSNLNVLPRKGGIQKPVCGRECFELEFVEK